MMPPRDGSSLKRFCSLYILFTFFRFRVLLFSRNYYIASSLRAERVRAYSF